MRTKKQGDVDIKITEIKTFVLGNPWKNWVSVKVFTDEGLVGIGELQLKELDRFVIGEGPLARNMPLLTPHLQERQGTERLSALLIA